MPKVSGYEKGRVPRSVRERQLLQVAERVFAREGFHEASLESVAREAGVTRQYLNKLFGDKEGLYRACHARARGQLDRLLLEAATHLPPGTDSPREVLRACAEAYFTFVREHGAGWDVLFGPGAAVAGPAAAEVERLRFETVEVLAAVMARWAPRIDPEDAEVFAHAMSGAGNQLAKWWQRNDVSVDSVVDRFVDLFWGGLRPYTDQ